MFSVISLNVSNKLIMLIVIILNVVMLSVVAPHLALLRHQVFIFFPFCVKKAIFSNIFVPLLKVLGGHD
jgi:hypothetical protein